MAMNENATAAPALHRERPATLTRRPSASLPEMLRRVVPNADEDRGLSRLDVAGFQSAI